MSTNTLLALGGDTEKQAKVLEYYNSNLDEWIELLNLDVDRTFFRSVVSEDKLVIVGGVRNGIASDWVQTYDFSVGTLTTNQPMRIARYYHAVAVLSRHVYVIAGFAETGVTNVAERYNPFTDKWTDVAPLLTARRNTGTAVLNDEIYIIGGMDNVNNLSIVESYNPVTESWKTCASLNEKRTTPAVAVIGKFIYVYGGYDGTNYLNTGERYEPLVNRWTKIHTSSVPRTRCGGCSFNDMMIVAGGKTVNGAGLNTVESYDVKDDKWSAKGSLQTPRSDLDLVKVPWKLIKQSQVSKEPKDENN